MMPRTLQRASLFTLLIGTVATGHAEVVLYGTGFEAPVIAVGELDEQDNWETSVNAAVNYDAKVSTQRSAGGTQSVRLATMDILPRSAAVYQLASPAVVDLGGPDNFFITTKLFVEQAAVPYDPPFDAAEGGWGMGLMTALGALIGMTIQADGELAYAHMNSPTSTIVNSGLSLLQTWVTLTMRRNPNDPAEILLSAVTDAGSWNGAMGMPSTTSSSSTFYIGGGRGSYDYSYAPLAPHPVAFYDDIRVGYNMSGPGDGTELPQPGTLWLLAIGLAGLAGVRARSPLRVWPAVEGGRRGADRTNRTTSPAQSSPSTPA